MSIPTPGESLAQMRLAQWRIWMQPPPPRVQKQVPSPVEKKGTHHMKKFILYSIPSFLGQKRCTFYTVKVLFYFWLLKSCAIYSSKFQSKWEKSSLFLMPFLKFSPSLLTLPPSPRLQQQKSSPLLETFLNHAHIKEIHHPFYEKSCAHVC